MVTALACFVIERGDSDDESLSPILLDELIELNVNQRISTNPTTDNYYAVKRELDELIRKEDRKIGLLKSKQRVEEEERKRVVAEQKKKDEQKLVQLSKTEAKKDNNNDWINVTASFYTAKCEGCIGITYNGTNVKNTIYTPKNRRVIAVDPNVIPLNSIVVVKLAGTEFTARAADIGSAIKGSRIDILVETKEEAFRLGMQEAQVRIVQRGD